ncbi:MAG: tyrosine--tRNA ligase [bacterium]|nr:tyrosine--tRNA ligase [bacterium]
MIVFNIEKLLNRGVEEVIEKSSLEKKLKSGKKLRVKLGIDPTKPDIHLGHTVPLRKLRQFQDAGHKAVLIIGDFTAQIGDPSGRSEERSVLTEREVKNNFKNYLRQAGKVIDLKKAEIRYNSEWLDKDKKIFLKLAALATSQQILERDDFQKRFQAGIGPTLLEMMYPLCQGYDSVMVKADVEIGGTDQKFNLLMGRRLQRRFNQPEQDIITLPLVEGTDGVRKMSKSFGNYIGLEEKPNIMFGKLMSIPDSLISRYFEFFTDAEQPKQEKPYNQKLILAETIVSIYHSAATSAKAKEEFLRVFSRKELPKELPKIKVGKNQLPLLELVVLASGKSRSECRRLIQQKAVSLSERVINDPSEMVFPHSGDVLRIGRLSFFKLEI